MLPQPVRMYNPKGPDRSAIVSVQPSTSAAGAFLIQLARGTGPGPLMKGTVFGPYPEAEIDARFADALAGLRDEGFVATGVHDLFSRLDSASAAIRARGALGLGWRRTREAVEPILDRMPKAVDEICSYMDALGAIGDVRAASVLREQAGRKLLSRRRSAVEALRNLGDADGLASAQQQALERLPDAVRTLVDSQDAQAQPIADAVLALKPEQRGLALDTLYELATPIAIAVVRLALPTLSFDQAHVWRYVKSIHKRAMLRHDYATFGWLSHAIEMASRETTGTQANVKSGYDGVQRQTRIFARKTQTFMKRLSWRYLRQLASYRPEAYALAAAEALIAYSPNDGEKPKGLYGQFACCYLLHRILWGASARFTMNDRSLRFRFRGAADVQPPANPAVREEAYPHLWDATPRAYVRLLAAAQLPEIHSFASRAVESRHPDLLRQADHADVVAMLQAPYEPTVKLALAELERRFDPTNPEWALLEHLLGKEHQAARELGERWLRLTAPIWTRDFERALAWLTAAHARTRHLAAEIAIEALAGDAALRSAFAAPLLERLRGGAIKDDVADAVVALARTALLDDMAGLMSLQELLAWIEKASVAILPLAGDLLGRRGESIDEIGVDRLGWLANHEVGAVRAGVQQVLGRQSAYFHTDAALLFHLAESEWEDTRKAAVELLRGAVRPDTLDLDGLLGFLDSNHVEVQNLGQQLARQASARVPADELALRLAQHPHANMRQFALEMAVLHLPDGGDALAKLEMFFRAALLDLWPSRALKKRVVEFVAERGLRDAEQAAVAVRILGEAVRLKGRADFERALESMTRIKLAYPEVASPVRLVKEAVA